jgi:CRP-like cAMP-binding protein
MLTTIEKVLLLQNVDLFTHVTSEQVSFFAALAEELDVAPGRVLYRENDPPDGFYVIVSGTVLMRKGDEEVERLGPNANFGAWALFDDQTRLTTAVSAEECRLLFVARQDFYDVLSDHVDIVEGLFKHLARRLRRVADAVEIQQ